MHYRKRRRDLEEEEMGARPVDEDEYDGNGVRSATGGAKKRTFGERMRTSASGGDRSRTREGDEAAAGEKSMSWTPASEGKVRADKAIRPKKQETFGKGLSKGAGSEEGVGVEKLSQDQRFGREKRRKPNRSASGNVMRGRK